jgi:hypothetical protein
MQQGCNHTLQLHFIYLQLHLVCVLIVDQHSSTAVQLTADKETRGGGAYHVFEKCQTGVDHVLCKFGQAVFQAWACCCCEGMAGYAEGNTAALQGCG